ncbi:alpha-amylase family glycosyl hydrolase [Bacillus sp. DTU_2020_1000418_1_SI_GHA_SEK_038]|uniref:alpha-amylase family glycosyl hydrolase n=1 Tax=Bacillus sp. DTU_2020_1000418_1_SI_GHA_SEK_038 TaxID=3077585 RepID=UPI0028E19C34|nr:alpha-amylase family glycosyl hydrolase [Bacillus sp. DTU_2020_1000418_1_SI_GHA_SEK_038]WNS76825.1 alpha-amylase family glycosyl hydrolase [Bacillus sp. DTU_2020_1000418_1_SI_GHA_SEK_038]
MVKRVWTLILIPLLLFYAQPVGAVEKEDRKWQDESIYFLMVDRFDNGDFKNDYHVNVKDPQSFHGGDFQGVIKKLDYIKDMGFTAIRLTPIFDNEENGYHGYGVIDYYNTEEHFGTIDEFKMLVKEIHNRNLKVMLDFPINHVGSKHEWLKDPTKKDWFKTDQSPNLQGLENEWINELPRLNHENLEVQEYLLDAAKWWINETNIDGYYLDEVDGVSKKFLTDFVQQSKSSKKDFYLLGEVRSIDPRIITEYEDTGIDGFLDFPLTETLRPAFVQVDQSLKELKTRKDELMSVYKNPNLMGSLLDDHKVDRFTRDMVEQNQHPGPRWKLALTYLYTSPGVPIVYYGSEIALDGGLGPDNHRQMDFRTDKDLIDYITKLGELRSNLPSLTRGEMKLLAEENGVLAYKRTYKNETTVIVINNSSESRNITINAEEFADDKELRGLLTNDLVKSNDHQYKIFTDREEAEIYILSQKSGMNIPYVTATVIVWGAFVAFIIAVWRRSKRKRSQE